MNGAEMDVLAVDAAAQAVLLDSYEFVPRAGYVVAFDTANETVALGVGKLVVGLGGSANSSLTSNSTSTAPGGFECSVTGIVSREVPAFRASNVALIPELDALLQGVGVSRTEITGVVCGRGPGSFTGVRICMASAKGLALALGVPLYGVSSADAQAWHQWAAGVRGSLVVLGDAMRKEVYPVHYELASEGPARMNSDFVMKAAQLPGWFAEQAFVQGQPLVTGDALKKYASICEGLGTYAAEEQWHPTGTGLLLAAQEVLNAAFADNWHAAVTARVGDPCVALPVYTRLSDAEEAERSRAAVGSLQPAPRNLVAGVQGHAPAAQYDASVAGGTSVDCHTPESVQDGGDAFGGAGAAVNATAAVTPPAPKTPAGIIRYEPLSAEWASAVAVLEAQVMGSDAWNEALVLDELPRADRTWWAAFSVTDAGVRTAQPRNATLLGYAGGWVVDGQVQLLKIATVPEMRRHGIARELLRHVTYDAQNLGATEITLEVRASNVAAHAFYERAGMQCIGKRPHYYSDKEDACIYTGPLPLACTAPQQAKPPVAKVAGMELQGAASVQEQAGTAAVAVAPEELSGGLILAIETSCDETAAALITTQGTIVANVVASQIDFHSRFGGVVPEIASRKHIEAIGGVVQECLASASANCGQALSWHNLVAVSATYAPGLVGALVVGLAFAKGMAWALNVPLVGVNHLEGHLYANKLACPTIRPPMVASLVSGGHTMLVHVKEWGAYETLGTTLDDAVGEAFDKVAKAMGLGYPGGPIISKLAKEGNPKAVHFPRALMHSGDLQFSLSGLKTSVITYLQKEEAAGRTPNKADVAASFQAAVIDVQVAKARTALEQTGAKEFCLGGGVAANPELRAAYEALCNKLNVRLTMPPLSACTDNAAMIALVALDRYKQGKFFDLSCDVAAHAPLDVSY